MGRIRSGTASRATFGGLARLSPRRVPCSTRLPMTSHPDGNGTLACLAPEGRADGPAITLVERRRESSNEANVMRGKRPVELLRVPAKYHIQPVVSRSLPAGFRGKCCDSSTEALCVTECIDCGA